MEWLTYALVFCASLVVVWGIERVSKRRRRSAPLNVPDRRAHYKAEDWFNDAKSHRPPPGPGGMRGF